MPSDSSPSRRPPLALFGVPAPWLLLPLLLWCMWVTGVATQRLIERDAAPHWPQVSATVTTASLLSIRHRRVDHWQFRIAYQYQVHHQTYTGDTIYLDHPKVSSLEARAMARQYPLGSKVPVYYNPDHPERAVLQPVAQGSAWFLLCMGVLLSVFCVVSMHKLARM